MSPQQALPLQSARDEVGSFRFNDLPGEIRNKVYKILLCNFDPEFDEDEKLVQVPTEITTLGHSIEPQILRVNRAIHEEAKYVLRKTNLFVKILGGIPFYQLKAILIPKRMPILLLEAERAKTFNHFVMTHEIYAYKSTRQQKYDYCCIFLMRDLPRFVGSLKNFSSIVSGHDESISHEVTLVDPYKDEGRKEPFYPSRSQESLIAPYRTLRDFQRFTIKGVPEDLAKAAVADITRSASEDPALILEELQEKKTKGNAAFRKGDTRLASEYWASALLDMNRMMSGARGQKLRANGGLDFINSLTALKFSLCSNRAQNYLKPMREAKMEGDQELVEGLGNGLFRAIEDAQTACWNYEGATWRPIDGQVAKVSYREAVGCRLVGTREVLGRAERAIEEALSKAPGDVELVREKERIKEWRKSGSS